MDGEQDAAARGSADADQRHVFERGDTALEVPLGPVAGGRSGRRRARIVLTAGIALLGVAIGLAVLPPRPHPPTADATSDSALSDASAAPASPLPSTTTPRPQSSSSRREALLPLLNEPLPGAPNPVVVERRGDDARLVAWNPGEPLRVVRTFTKAFTGDGQAAVVSPDATALVVATIHPSSEDARDTARLITNDGLVAWEGSGITTSRGITWSSDSRKVVLVGAPGTWWVVTIDPAGTAASQRVVIVGQSDATSTPSPPAVPFARPSDNPVDLAPVGFSVDGAWLYASATPRGGAPVGPTVRVSIPGGFVDTILGYAASGSARLAADDGLRGIDPATGRTIRWGANGAIAGGPPTVEVDDADGTLAYRVQTGIVLGAAWEPSGDLLILEADGYPFPTRLSLLPVAPDGAVGTPIMSTGPVAFGGLLGARNGFAVLAIGTRQPTDGIQFVVVNLVDGTASGLTLPPDETGILGASLLP
jgi:hypothetical protein